MVFTSGDAQIHLQLLSAKGKAQFVCRTMHFFNHHHHPQCPPTVNSLPTSLNHHHCLVVTIAHGRHPHPFPIPTTNAGQCGSTTSPTEWAGWGIPASKCPNLTSVLKCLQPTSAVVPSMAAMIGVSNSSDTHFFSICKKNLSDAVVVR